MAEKESIHAGHRERIRQRFREQGLTGFAEHEALELLLTFAIARKDVNPLAHELIAQFGSLAAVLEADKSELLRVQGVYAVGASHYDEQAILDMAGIAVGDELLSTAPDETEQRLLRNMPYLATVSVERTLRGQVTIVVTERTPLFALEMGDGQVALLDEHMRVLELGQRDVIGMSLCQVAFELFPRDDEQTMTPGDTYRGNPTAVGKVSAILEAALSLCPETPPVRLDMNDPYNVQLTLSDGTVIALHECTSPQRQLRTAMDAIETYRDFHGHVDETLRVDVDDFFRVSLRPLPPAGQ